MMNRPPAQQQANYRQAESDYGDGNGNGGKGKEWGKGRTGKGYGKGQGYGKGGGNGCNGKGGNGKGNSKGGSLGGNGGLPRVTGNPHSRSAEADPNAPPGTVYIELNLKNFSLFMIYEINSKNDTTMPNLLMPMICASNFIKNYKSLLRLTLSIHIVSSSDRFY
jgi:hypothetical protein